MSKKITAIILALAALLSLAACGSSSAPEQSAAPAQENTAQENAAQEMRIVTDTWGRKVEIPYNVESIICLGSGAPRMAAYLDVVDMMVGVEDHDKEAYNILRDYNPVYRDEIKELPAVGSGGGSGANNGYAEEIITVAPDVILAGFSAEAADELYGQTGIPVVCVRYLSRNFVDESFYDAMRDKIVCVYAGNLDTNTLAKALRTALPKYMLPNVYEKLEALPHNANGKLDRAALKKRFLHAQS